MPRSRPRPFRLPMLPASMTSRQSLASSSRRLETSPAELGYLCALYSTLSPLHTMSYEGQTHHPHTPGNPPNPHLIPLAHYNDHTQPYIPAGLELMQAHWFVRHGERARGSLSANCPAAARFDGGPHSCRPHDPMLTRLRHAAVRQRLVGVGEIPAMFPLCSIGRDFRTSVLSFASGSPSTDGTPPPPPPASLPTLATAGGQVEASTMEVRRLAEDVDSSARGTVGGMSDWCATGRSFVDRLDRLTRARLAATGAS